MSTPKLAQATESRSKEDTALQSVQVSTVSEVVVEATLSPLATLPSLPSTSTTTFVLSSTRPPTLPTTPSSSPVVEIKPSSLAPEGPSMIEEAPPVREEGDWRSVTIGQNSSIFKDYGLAEKLPDLILLPID